MLREIHKTDPFVHYCCSTNSSCLTSSRKNLLSGISREQVVEMLLDEGSFFPAVNESCSALLLPCLPILLERSACTGKHAGSRLWLSQVKSWQKDKCTANFNWIYYVYYLQWNSLKLLFCSYNMGGKNPLPLLLWASKSLGQILHNIGVNISDKRFVCFSPSIESFRWKI